MRNQLIGVLCLSLIVSVGVRSANENSFTDTLQETVEERIGLYQSAARVYCEATR